MKQWGAEINFQFHAVIKYARNIQVTGDKIHFNGTQNKGKSYVKCSLFFFSLVTIKRKTDFSQHFQSLLSHSYLLFRFCTTKLHFSSSST